MGACHCHECVSQPTAYGSPISCPGRRAFDAHGSVVGRHLQEPGNLLRRLSDQPYSAERMHQGHGQVRRQVMPLTQVRTLVGEHEPRLVVVEQGQSARAHDYRAPARQATREAVRGGTGIVKENAVLPVYTRKPPPDECEPVELVEPLAPRPPGLPDEASQQPSPDRKGQQHPGDAESGPVRTGGLGAQGQRAVREEVAQRVDHARRHHEQRRCQADQQHRRERGETEQVPGGDGQPRYGRRPRGLHQQLRGNHADSDDGEKEQKCGRHDGLASSRSALSCADSSGVSCSTKCISAAPRSPPLASASSIALAVCAARSCVAQYS